MTRMPWIVFVFTLLFSPLSAQDEHRIESTPTHIDTDVDGVWCSPGLGWDCRVVGNT